MSYCVIIFRERSCIRSCYLNLFVASDSCYIIMKLLMIHMFSLRTSSPAFRKAIFENT